MKERSINPEYRYNFWLNPGNRLLYISQECDEICQVSLPQCFESAALQLSGFNIRTEEEVVVSAANYRYSAEIFNDGGGWLRNHI